MLKTLHFISIHFSSLFFTRFRSQEQKQLFSWPRRVEFSLVERNEFFYWSHFLLMVWFFWVLLVRTCYIGVIIVYWCCQRYEKADLPKIVLINWWFGKPTILQQMNVQRICKSHSSKYHISNQAITNAGKDIALKWQTMLSWTSLLLWTSDMPRLKTLSLPTCLPLNLHLHGEYRRAHCWRTYANHRCAPVIKPPGR